MLQKLIDFDIRLFLFLNEFHSPFWDSIMVFTSSKFGWVPLYLFIIYLIYRKYKNNIFMLLAFFVLLIFIADQSSVQLFKEVFKRYRPCHNSTISHLVYTVNGKCGGMYGFVSSHASNMFAIASFTSLLLQHRYFSVGIFLWASLVAYSRIYLGVHFPADIVGGAALGIGTGYLVYYLYKKYGNKLCRSAANTCEVQ